MLEVKEIRSLTGLSQTKFAKEYNIPLSTLKRWEQGVSKAPNYYLWCLNELVKYNGVLYEHSIKS